ncbi:AraC family transcriptional regulator [Fundicoccus culcitae]|uniref:AraC family transcriptional regulator n=1 Tax=Fundicoccus culcitae TaxID=2969821 RepID=A0ABY5P6T1_9LACT|nr:AraC family transcriptional regulator [Fundicoccus culcitae]UUX34446.1 AraC family transcriptional regulator [Fundicoccus culcitae]
MYNQSTINCQSDYFSLVEKQPDLKSKPLNALVDIRSDYTDTLFSFRHPVTVTAKDGLSIIGLTNSLSHPSHIQTYLLEGSIEIPPSVYFNVISLNKNSRIYLESQDNDEPKLLAAPQRITVALPSPSIVINNIFTLNHQAKSSPYEETGTDHPYYELILVEQGELTLTIDGNSLTISRHECAVIFPNQYLHKQIKNDSITSYISIIFDAIGIPKKVKQNVFSLKNQLSYVFNQLIHLSNNEVELFSMDRLYHLVYAILIHIAAGPLKTDNKPRLSMRENYENEVFQSMVNYIEENIDKPVQISDLAEHFSLSRSSIQKYFKKYTNETPKEYINTIKLQHSKELIRNSQMSLSEISKAVGYGSSQYFSRVFSEKYGMSPSNYAKSVIK